MKIEAIKTHKITVADKDLFAVLDQYLPELSEGSVLAIASKIIAICEGRVVARDLAERDDLIRQESELYIAPEYHKYGLTTSIAHNLLMMNGGVDESNVDGGFVLWPSDPQLSANRIRAYLAKRFNLQKVGVVITDGRLLPLRWGVVGASLASSGFKHLNSYVGKPDLFGRPFKVTYLNVDDGLATAASLVMGEGSEQTPLAVISDLSIVQFTGRDPTEEEIQELKIAPEDDLYGPLLVSAPWQRGGK